jgi:hypothetical protein
MLNKYTSVTGGYTDCYMTEIPRTVPFPEYILAFYTTPLFKLERFILLTVSKPSTDFQARHLANGLTERFAAWTVEGRNGNEILLCDFLSRTRSWLMTKSNGVQTQLYFGSAVVPKTGEASLDVGFRGMLMFHKVYSVLLLHSAKSSLSQQC